MQYSYDWKKMLDDYLFSGDQPLFNNFIAGRKSNRMPDVGHMDSNSS